MPYCSASAQNLHDGEQQKQKAEVLMDKRWPNGDFWNTHPSDPKKPPSHGPDWISQSLRRKHLFAHTHTGFSPSHIMTLLHLAAVNPNTDTCYLVLYGWPPTQWQDTFAGLHFYQPYILCLVLNTISVAATCDVCAAYLNAACGL